ncbi:MAG: EAL domain-containing protein [Lachnospiraceae bacterium]|uniref:EAL domain-containing protein n=1 Tax=Candidatus Weimeria bifida TaxID=2599074 RepID=A0A6N7IXR6_9FIRM|nr:EAL domain-containing protein [Candidatus Weimeria bifida]RRF95442.1 MAG: EAL domain-containing protein [Lachnospiraceae bacterium]
MESAPDLFGNKTLLNSLFQAFTVSDDGRYLFVLNENTGDIRWCHTAVDFFGLSGEQIQHGDQDFLLRIHPEDRPEYEDQFEAIRARVSSKVDVKCRIKDKNGSYVNCEVTASYLNMSGAASSYIAGTVINFGIQNRIDTVTSLPNLYAFFNDIKEGRESGERGTVLLIGATRFSEINEVYGYSFGNQVLIAFTDLLRSYVGGECELYRMEGAKFAVKSNSINKIDLEAIYQKIRLECKQGIEVEHTRVHIFLACGAMELGDNKISSHTLYSCLLYAYADSKDRHQGELIFFHNHISNKNKQWLEELNVIRESVIDGCRGFFLCYQPIIRVADGTFSGMEALIRWKNEKYGVVSPDEFISILEKDTVFPELGNFIMRQACIDAKSFVDKDPDFIVNVNLSYAQIEKSDFADSVINILEETNFPAKNLCLELTERCRVMDENMLRDKVVSLHAQGIKFALDDFGTGYSSLNLLRKMPIDEVKIDRQFIKDIFENRIDQNIINGLTHSVTDSGKSICIEGIENEDLQTFLQRYPVTYFQGYLYSKPVPIEKLKRINFEKRTGLGPQLSKEDLIAVNEQVDNVIIRCAKYLHNGDSLDDAVAKVLAEMGNLIHPDRIYFGQIDNGEMKAAKVWSAPGVEQREFPVTRDLYNLKWWERYANKDDVIIVSDVKSIMKNAPDTIVDPRCHNFMGVMLKDNKQIVGYIGVENYVKSEVLNTKSLIQTISLFLTAELKNQKLIDQLTNLSRKDQLAGCYNRNAYEEDMIAIERKHVPLGMIFADLNGLKVTNDSYGHSKGDELIIRAVELLEETYSTGTLYRIGGDEFIVTFLDDDEPHFYEMMKEKLEEVDKSMISISIGWSWTDNSATRERAQLIAEQMMYKRKAAYYMRHDRRKSASN